MKNNNLVTTLILLVSVLVSPNLFAAKEPIVVQRAEFVAAEKALAKGHTKTYRALKAKLTQYPLYPYLEYKELRRRLSSAKSKQIQAFLDKYPDTPVSSQLRRAWLNYLGKKQRWKAYLKFYTGSGNVKRQCYHVHALIKTGKKKEAWPLVKPLWLVGKSQPDECTPVFDAWNKAGFLSAKIVWQRVELAMEKRQSRLARYLSKLMSKKDKRLVDLWRKVYRDPGVILKDRKFKKDSHILRTILVYGIKRMARKDPMKALATWEKLATNHKFEKYHEHSVKRFIGIRLARKNDPNAIAYLDKLSSKAENKTLREWRIRVALQNSDWAHVLKWTTKLPKAEMDDNWVYWKAKSLKALGKDKKANKLFKQLAKSRDFYGFLSADILSQPYALGDKPLVIKPAEYQSISKIKAVKRAKELYKLNRLIEARREWYQLSLTFSNRQLQIAAKLADQWKWHDRAIISLAKAKYWHDLVTRFPIAHKSFVTKFAHKQDIEPAWVYAVIRQESAFIKDARSGVGAMGLMQLMPRTAKQVAQQLKRKFKSKYELLEAETNITLGTAYLRSVLNKLDNHSVLATAAYNAGTHRVKRWLPENIAMPADVWVELIPFNETRKYVRRVMAYTVIYEQRLGLKPTSLKERMRPIRILKNMVSLAYQWQRKKGKS